MADFGEILRRARSLNYPGSLKLGATDATDATHRKNKQLGGSIKASAGATRCYQPEALLVAPRQTLAGDATGEMLSRNSRYNKELYERVAPEAPVAHTEAAENFLIDQATVEKYEAAEAEYQRQLAELRAANAKVYANPTPWRRK